MVYVLGIMTYPTLDSIQVCVHPSAKRERKGKKKGHAGDWDWACFRKARERCVWFGPSKKKGLIYPAPPKLPVIAGRTARRASSNGFFFGFFFSSWLFPSMVFIFLS